MKYGKACLATIGIALVIHVANRQNRKSSRVPVAAKVHGSGALHALNAWADQRTYPHESFPQQGFFQAFVHSQFVLKKAAKSLQVEDTWESIGPDNVGGRTNALMLDPNNPNILYAGSASGGLWRMTMEGNDYSWEYMETGFPVLGVNAIAVDPLDSKIIYIGTGEVYGYQSSVGSIYIRKARGSYGIGLLKSLDSGQTWEKSLDWSYHQQRGVLSLAINPFNPQVVFAGTSEGLYKTTDAGGTWDLVHEALMAVDVAIKPGDTSVVYVSCGNLGSRDGGVYRSIAGGEPGTFHKLTRGLPETWTGKTMLSVCPDNSEVVYADVADDTATVGLYYSQNNGDTWTLRTDENYASYQGWFSHYVRVNPDDCDNLMIGGVEYYTSNDGGGSLRHIVVDIYNGGMHVDHHCYANHPADVNTVYLGNDGGVYRTTDGGETYQAMNQGYVTSQFHPGFSSSATDPELALGGLQDNWTRMYNGTHNWSDHLSGDGVSTAIDPENNDIIYAGSQRLWIQRSDNRGRDWQYIAHDTYNQSKTSFIAPFLLAPSEPNILYAGGDVVFKTVNRGGGWTKMNGGDPIGGGAIIAMGISYTDADVLYVTVGPTDSSRSQVYKTLNGGQSWVNITGTLPDRYYMDVVVSPLDDQVVYLALAGFGTSHLYWSEYGGGDWVDIGQGLPDAPASAVIIDPNVPDHIYVGNDLGVYVSVDHGQTWYTFKEDMPTAAMVMDLSLSLSNHKIRAVTHGNGVYERSLLPSGFAGTGQGTDARGYRLWQQASGELNSIGFALPQEEYVSLMIYDMKGKPVKSWPARRYPAGEYRIAWKGRDNGNRTVPNGAYVCRMRAGKIHKSATVRVQG